MVEMKRLIRESDQNTGIVDALLLLSRGGDEVSEMNHNHKRVFKCKTCNKQFSSFQALGGHRASHKKPRLADGDMGRAQSAKPRAHECSICGHEFATGQALGGHMRRHRANNDGFGRVEKKVIAKRVDLWDLNLPASGNDVEHRDLGLGLELELGLGLHYVHKATPMVDCFH